VKHSLHQLRKTNHRSITSAPRLTALTNNNRRLKVPDWRLWAYTDVSSLTYNSQLYIYVLEQESLYLRKTAAYVYPGGIGISNTINKTKLTGMASAQKCMH